MQLLPLPAELVGSGLALLPALPGSVVWVKQQHAHAVMCCAAPAGPRARAAAAGL